MPPQSPSPTLQAAATTTVQLLQLDELPALRIRNAHAEALIMLQGAQVLEFTPRGQRPVIWLSERAEFKRGANIRGGIPICWPWFGDMTRNPAAVQNGLAAGAAAPAHGLVRAQAWLLESIAETADTTQIVLRYPVDALMPIWPQAAELRLSIRIGATLQLQLATRNIGSPLFSLTQALHSYFAISDTRQIELRGFENTRYIDTLKEWREYLQNGPLRIDGEVDRIYRQVPQHVQLYDAGWQRTIHLRSRNSASVVVWNPHIEKSKRLNQLSDSAWQHMVCIETANVMDDCVLLAAGAERILDVEIYSEASGG